MQNYNANTSDDQSELFWEVDENDNVIGPVPRHICHNETRKPWHRSTHTYIFHPNGDLYLSQRSLHKDTAPGQWTVSASGHVKYGFSYIETAQIEIVEELELEGVELIEIDKLKINYGTEREFICIYAGVTDKVPNPNLEEVNQIKLFDFFDIVEKFTKGEFDLSGGSRNTFRHIIDTGTLKKHREKIVKI